MSDLIEQLISDVLEKEGGYVNHAADRGGATNFGITQATLAAWRGKPVTAADVQAMTEGEARQIYRERYFADLGDIKDKGLLKLMFDYAVNSGTSGAIRGLQRVLDVEADGVYGPRTRAALLALPDQGALFLPLVCERLSNFLHIIGNNYSQAVFARGWANRMASFWGGKER